MVSSRRVFADRMSRALPSCVLSGVLYVVLHRVLAVAAGCDLRPLVFRSSESAHYDHFFVSTIVLDAGYSGFVGIEYEGSVLDEFAGIRATTALLERVRSELG